MLIAIIKIRILFKARRSKKRCSFYVTLNKIVGRYYSQITSNTGKITHFNLITHAVFFFNWESRYMKVPNYKR